MLGFPGYILGYSWVIIELNGSTDHDTDFGRERFFRLKLFQGRLDIYLYDGFLEKIENKGLMECEGGNGDKL